MTSSSPRFQHWLRVFSPCGTVCIVLLLWIAWILLASQNNPYSMMGVMLLGAVVLVLFIVDVIMKVFTKASLPTLWIIELIVIFSIPVLLHFFG